MKHGWLMMSWWLLLGLFSHSSAATVMTQEEASSWMVNPQVQVSTEQLYQLALQDKIADLQTALQAIPLPKQEVTRYLLLKRIESDHLALSPSLLVFLQSQQQQQPVYQLIESYEDYSTSYPAFNTALVANRVLSAWQQEQRNIDLIMAVESGELQLKDWLQGDEFQRQQKEQLFLQEVDRFSEPALQQLVQQIDGSSVVQWLPSTAIVIKLAQRTQDEKLYDVLWKMKANDSSVEEVQRLGQVADSFSLQQVMNATKNPVLKPLAIQQLVKVQPMTPSIQAFLIEKLNQNSDGLMVARALSESEHHDWLVSLVQEGQVSHGQNLLQSMQAYLSISAQ